MNRTFGASTSNSTTMLSGLRVLPGLASAAKLAAAVCAVALCFSSTLPVASAQIYSRPTIEAAPDTPAGELLVMTARDVVTWENEDPTSPTGTASVVQLGSVEAGAHGQTVSLRVDRTQLTAKSAIVWINPAPDTVGDKQLVRIALLGDAVVEQDGVRRSGPTLYVTAVIRGSIQITPPRDGTRQTRNLASGETYTLADNLRKVAEEPLVHFGPAVVARAAGEPGPQRSVQSVDIRKLPVRFTAGYSPTIVGPDGKMVVLLSGGAAIFSQLEDGTFVELRAERAVLFTNATSLQDMEKARTSSKEVFTGAYLEGDVRVVYTPGGASSFGQARLEGQRIYYDLGTNRAMVTDAVLHSLENSKQIPLVLRAKTVEQIAEKQYIAKGVEVSTSSFATPTYSLRASKVYVREVPPENQSERGTTNFQATNVTFNALGAPFFYLPYAAGDPNSFPLRTVAFEDSDKFGVGLRTEWGLFESLGQPPPKGVDASFRLDYLDSRGPATGLDAKYQGGLVTETTAEPWNYEGDFKSYYINDKGWDRFGGGGRIDTYAGARRRLPDPNAPVADPPVPNVTGERQWNRGNFLWEHQHFLPDDWQVQLRAGYASDPTFLEQFFQRDFNRQLPYELAFYAKHQVDTEQFYFLATTPLNNFPTTADEVQEQAEIQRLPEFGYNRVGDAVLDDDFTFFSNNTLSALSFKTPNESYFDALQDQGYNASPLTDRNSYGPGLPSYALTGRSSATVGRADLRQELDYPTELGQFKVVPYVVGRYTGYSDSPGTARTRFDVMHNPYTDVTGSTGAQNRVYAAAGARVTTAFWRIDDTAQSELFDIHRVRHVIEPGANAFVSASTVDRSEVYIYDEDIDGIHDINAGQLQLLQRWQTKRGGPGHWRNVDFLTLNVEANFFAQDPHELAQRQREIAYVDDKGDNSSFDARSFRGLFFSSLPEASIPRDSVNADASWRISDTTLLVADEKYNLEESTLATAAVGIGITRDPRLSYYVEQRYIDPLNSNITSFDTRYVVSAKYTLFFNVSYDFAYKNNVSRAIAIQRQFDRIKAIISFYQDSINDDTGMRLFVIPDGLNGRGPGRFFDSLEAKQQGG